MNYIQEINSFRVYTAMDPLTANAQALWFLLMHINNSCGWIEWFRVSNSRLSNELCLSEKTMRNQRDILIEKGIILYQSQRRKKNSGMYKLISFEEFLKQNGYQTTVNTTVDCESTAETTVNSPVDYETTVETTVNSPVDCKTTVNAPVVFGENKKTTFQIPDINKSSSNIISTTTEFEIIHDFFNDNFHTAVPYEKKMIQDWLNNHDSSVIILAMKESLKNDIKTVKYVEGILRNWLVANLKSVKDIEDHMQRFSKKQYDDKSSNVTQLKPKNSFHNFSQHETKYTKEELEIKLGIRK